jgi:hypothetical protein
MSTIQPVLRADYSVFPFVGASVPCDATRIDAACFRDGNEDEFIIEFWWMSGSVLRTEYNRRTTVSSSRFVSVRCWEFAMLKKMAMAIEEGSWFSI